MRNELQFNYSKLSPRERETFSFLFTAKPMKTIAYEMKVDTTTIDTFAVRIYEKFHVGNRIGLILQVLAETKGKLPVDSHGTLVYTGDDESHKERIIRDAEIEGISARGL